jgi:hypothetical protein
VSGRRRRSSRATSLSRSPRIFLPARLSAAALACLLEALEKPPRFSPSPAPSPWTALRMPSSSCSLSFIPFPRSEGSCNLLGLPEDLAQLLTGSCPDTFLCPNCLAGVHQARRAVHAVPCCTVLCWAMPRCAETQRAPHADLQRALPRSRHRVLAVTASQDHSCAWQEPRLSCRGACSRPPHSLRSASGARRRARRGARCSSEALPACRQQQQAGSAPAAPTAAVHDALPAVLWPAATCSAPPSPPQQPRTSQEPAQQPPAASHPTSRPPPTLAGAEPLLLHHSPARPARF